MINHNPTSGIAYGYISADALDPDIVNDLQMNGTDVHYKEALSAYIAEKRREIGAENWENGEFDEDWCKQEFDDSYQPDEPIHEGTKDGVKYRTSWLGGALNVWIFESPFITHLAREASPCVPGAAILDVLDGSVTGYDVPPDWRRTEG